MAYDVASSPMFRVLFVCTGNICRSPSAHGVFRHLVRAANLEHRIEADSAGLAVFPVGTPPDKHSIAAAYKRGYGIADLRSQHLKVHTLKNYNMILAMDYSHLQALSHLASPDIAMRIQLFLDYAPQVEVREIPDPYGGTIDRFDWVLTLIEAGVHGLVQEICCQLDIPFSL